MAGSNLEFANATLEGSFASLKGQIVTCNQLTGDEISQMFALFSSYYENASSEVFNSDLREKSYVLLFHDETCSLKGFSTLMEFQTEIQQKRITIFFSGDTILAKEIWGSFELPKLWSRYVFQLAAKNDIPAYWFLISSGYKTYRFLPVFFRDFFPCCKTETPAPTQQLLDEIALKKFGTRYKDGIVKLENPTPLRAGIADITNSRLNDPHVLFFNQVNPGWTQGDELACITQIDVANLTPAGRRMLGVS